MFRKLITAISAAIKVIKPRGAAFAVMAVVSAACIAFAASSLYRVTVTDGETTRVVTAYYGDPDRVLASVGISCGPDDVVSSNTEGRSEEIIVDRAFNVTVTLGNDSKVIATQECSVAEAVAKAGVELTEYDLVMPALDTMLTADAYVDVVDVDYSVTSEEKAIPYKTVTVKSSEYLSGQIVTTTRGSEGVKLITYTEKLVNGEVVSTDVSEEVIKDPVDEVVTLGTRRESAKSSNGSKPEASAAVAASADTSKWISTLTPEEPILLDDKGVPLNYTMTYTGTATAYSGTQGTAWSKTGNAFPGIVAVDPRKIPYGTRMYIVSADGRYIYGYCIAADTGGAARSGRIIADLFFPTEDEANDFGRRPVNIYILP